MKTATATPATTQKNKNPSRRPRKNPRRRKKNGAGLGAFVGSLAGVTVEGILVAAGVASSVTLPLGLALSVVGGAIGGHYAAPSDRKERGATGGGIGGVFGPLGAALGGYIGGRKPDRKSNPMSPLVGTTVAVVAAVGVGYGIHRVMQRRKIRAALPSNQPGATPENQGATTPIDPQQVPATVLDAELAKGGVPVEPWWKTVQVRVYRDHFIRVDEDTRMVQPYMDGDKVCAQSTVRWVVVAGEATWLATGTLEHARACAKLPPGGFGGGTVQDAQQQIYDQASLSAMDWIDLAYPKTKVA